MKKENTTVEVWKDVKGYEGFYQVSNFGRIKRTGKTIVDSKGRNQTHGEKILKQNFSDGRYLTVKLSIKNIHKTIRTHRIVCDAFCNNPKNLKTVDHIDFNRTNNKASNLEWVSQKENNKRFQNVFQIKGEKSSGAKLTDKDIFHIRNEAACGIKQNKIAKGYCVSRTLVSNIVNKKLWTHI